MHRFNSLSTPPLSPTHRLAKKLTPQSQSIDWKADQDLTQKYPRNRTGDDAEDFEGDAGSFFHFFTEAADPESVSAGVRVYDHNHNHDYNYNYTWMFPHECTVGRGDDRSECLRGCKCDSGVGAWSEERGENKLHVSTRVYSRA